MSNSDIYEIHKKRIWRVGDAAIYLQCSRKHIYELARLDKIPSFKKGKFRYFLPEDIEAWLVEGNLT